MAKDKNTRGKNGMSREALSTHQSVVDQILANREAFDREVVPFLSLASVHGDKMTELFRATATHAKPDPRVFLNEAAENLAFAAGALFAFWHASKPTTPEENRRMANQIIGIGRSWRRAMADFDRLTKNQRKPGNSEIKK